jgi:uncharacterized protein (UPF0335 family)
MTDIMETIDPQTAQLLKQYTDRLMNLERQKQELMNDIKDVMAEAKSNGFDIKIIRKIITILKKDPNKIAEEEALLETYKAALGLI